MDILQFRVTVEQELAKRGIDSDKFPGLIGAIAINAIRYAESFTDDVVAGIFKKKV